MNKQHTLLAARVRNWRGVGSKDSVNKRKYPIGSTARKRKVDNVFMGWGIKGTFCSAKYVYMVVYVGSFLSPRV